MSVTIPTSCRNSRERAFVWQNQQFDVVCTIIYGNITPSWIQGVCLTTVEPTSFSWDVTHETIKTLPYRHHVPPGQSACSVPTTLVRTHYRGTWHSTRLACTILLLSYYMHATSTIQACSARARPISAQHSHDLTSPRHILTAVSIIVLCLFLNKMAGFNWTIQCAA